MNLKTLLTITLTLMALAAPLCAADLSEADKQFLSNYEKLHMALAADDLAAAKKAAIDLGDEAKDIANADKIAAARAGFARLSERAIPLTHGQSGYYVVNCPMLKKDWVQTSTQISNPYAGKSMLTCGVIKK